MKNKIFNLILALSIIISVFNFTIIKSYATMGGSCGTNLSWKLDDSGKLTISGTGKMTDFIFEEYRHTCPWYDCKHLITSVEILEGVTGIGYSTFYGCSGLTSVEILSGVTFIGGSAFSGCYNLTSITISEGVTSIGDDAFYFCRSLTSIEIPSGVTSIGYSAFYGCSGLTSIIIPDSVTSVGNYAFLGCLKLNSIVASFSGYNLTTLGVNNNDSLNITITNRTSIDYQEFSGYSNLKSITIPDSVTTIGSEAFYNCNSLTSFEIPNSVTSIGDSAFYGCNGLTSITIPESVTSIGQYAFRDCTGLTDISLPNRVTSTGDSAFYGCSSLTSITIPKSVTSIDDYAFFGCSSLSSVEIPDSVASIGNSAFSGCSSLSCVEIPDSVASIGNSAFSGCSGLTSISIPGSVKSIGGNAFYNCSSLTNITIPDSVTSIGEGVFDSCVNLKSITTPFVGASRDSSDFDGTLHYWFGENYSKGLYGANYRYIPSSLKKITITDDDEISNEAFYDSKIREVEIGSKTTTIARYAFAGCEYLKKIIIPSSVENFGYRVFEGANNITIYCEKDSFVEKYALSKGLNINNDEFNVNILCDKEYVIATATIPYFDSNKNLHIVEYNNDGNIINYYIFPKYKSNTKVNFGFRKGIEATFIKAFMSEELNTLSPPNDSIELIYK